MAIFSLRHSFIGRSTHPPGAASNHARYITRADACTEVLGERMPTERRELVDWLDGQERGDRRNARVIDQLTVALPRELDHEENKQLLRQFCERMSEGRAGWVAAIHDGPGDEDNPHAHVLFRDRDFETGKRAMLTTEMGSTQRFRDGWEQECNIALERAGREERVDGRSLQDQGIDREPQIHVGAGAQHLTREAYEFRSNMRETTRIIGGQATEWTVNYPRIDEGKTRWEENEERKARNRERELEHAMEGPVRPGTDEAQQLAMARAVQSTIRLDALYHRAMLDATLPPDDSDPVVASLREHIGERKSRGLSIRWEQEQKPDWRPFEFSEERSARHEPMPARRGPYAGGREGKRENEPEGRMEVDLPGPREPIDASADKASRRDGADLLAGAGLSAVGRIADSLESMFDDRSGREIEKDEAVMAQERKIEQITEQKQRQEEAEYTKWRQKELDMMLEQRARERGIERGR